MVDGVLTGLSFKRLLTGAVILNGWAPRPMENGTESEITILDIQGSELGDGDTNLDFTGPVVALAGGRSPAQPKIKIDQLSSSNQKVEHSILFKDGYSDRMFLKIAGQNNLKGTGISDCYDTEEIISVSKVR
ncbi:hypothetical protein WN944_022248 [Citrus x changshan-huyou]|uniref:Uncharacterized protein n=1 Tax=Citrus x changshan-huyou TaxID=2935761 RepID=A0AAP0R140_9ROSI